MVAVVILLRVWQECGSGGNELSNVSSFIILRSGEGLTSFKKDNSANFSGESKVERSVPWYFLIIHKNTLSQISYLQSFSSSNLKLSISNSEGHSCVI